MEVWAGLKYQGKDYSAFYEISNFGHIRNSRTKYVCKTYITHSGYSYICVSLGSKKLRKGFRIHKAVAETFIPNPNNLPMINHKDGIKTNNYAGTPENNFTDGNLEWCDNSYNVRHALKMGLIDTNKYSGENNVFAKLSNKDVAFIREHYIPFHKLYGARPLARRFGVTHHTIISAYNGETWKNI